MTELGAPLILPYGADGTPDSVVIDGVTYRVLRVDAGGRLSLALPFLAHTIRNANENYASAQTNNELIAAPAAGLSLYLAAIVYSRDTAGNMKLVENTGTPVTIFGPHYFGANDGMSAVLDPPRKLTAATNLGITTVGGGNESITVLAWEA